MTPIKRKYAKTYKELDEMTKELRGQGYSLITYTKSFRELENKTEIIVITIERKKAGK